MLTFAHGNKNGTGSRLEVEMTPATQDEDGFVRLVLTNQDAEDANRNTHHSFVEEDFVSIDLDAKKLAHILAVLEGDSDCLSNGKGVRFMDGKDSVLLHMDAVREPFVGCAIHIISWYEGRKNGEGRINLNQAEARTLASAIEASMGQIAFGR